MSLLESYHQNRQVFLTASGMNGLTHSYTLIKCLNPFMLTVEKSSLNEHFF